MTDLKQVWLNPPRHDDPHEDVVIRLSQAAAGIVADALEEAAVWASRDGARDAARVLLHTADDIESASVAPADESQLSREATWHPANIMQRVTPAAIRNAARYLGPAYVAGDAIRTAAAVAWSKGGDTERDAVIQHLRWALTEAASTEYPEHGTPRESYDRPVTATAARTARRKKLGLPPVVETPDA